MMHLPNFAAGCAQLQGDASLSCAPAGQESGNFTSAGSTLSTDPPGSYILRARVEALNACGHLMNIAGAYLTFRARVAALDRLRQWLAAAGLTFRARASGNELAREVRAWSAPT